MTGGGRPSKLTEETQKKLCEMIVKGATYRLACNYAGIGYTTFREWMNKGKSAKGKNKYTRFLNSIKRAEGEAVRKWLDIIDDSAEDGNWQAAAWKLERRYPDDYGKRIRQEIKAQNLDINFSDLTDEQLKRLAAGESLPAVLK